MTEPVPATPSAETLEEWRDILADCLWWFYGFAAAQSSLETYERTPLPDVSRIRVARDDMARIAEGKQPSPRMEF